MTGTAPDLVAEFASSTVKEDLHEPDALAEDVGDRSPSNLRAGVPAAVRIDARRWIETNWDPSRSLLEWRMLLVDSGWAVPSWPRRWHGRELPGWADAVVADELARAGAVGLALGGGTSLAAPTLLEHGSAELNDRLLRPILTGEHRYCQLFSEPTNGSDLAGLTTRAFRDGEEWIVNGQKLWTTSAHHADFAILLARTDPTVPKHAGISYFVLPMRQPGVEVRPLRQMNGHASFNEVFLTDARVPAAHLVGREGDGWKIALTTLAHERGFATMRRRTYTTGSGRAIDEAAAEAEEHFRTYAWYPQRAGRPDLMADAARRSGANEDAVVRNHVAAVTAMQRANEWTAKRSAAARALGRKPGPEGSLGKLGASNVARSAARAHTAIGGPWTMLRGDDSIEDGILTEIALSVPAQAIAGGTDEIQRNIIGERVLGLPKEPDPNR